MNKYLLYSLFCIVIIVSVYTRKDYINTKLTPDNYCELMTFTTTDVWQQRGISDCSFAAIQTYGHATDKHVTYYKRLESDAGDNYFVSFPPFFFQFYYLVESLTGLHSNKLMAVIFNFLLQVLSAFLLFKLLLTSLNTQFANSISQSIAFIGFAMYMVSPSLIYLHTVIFFPEMMGQFLFLLSLYILQKTMIHPHSKKWMYVFYMVVFLFTYTEWMGLFFSGIVAVIFFRKHKKFAVFTFLSAALAMFLMFIQYASIAGFAVMLKAMTIRFVERSGLFNEKYSDMGLNYFSTESYMRLFTNLQEAFVGIALVLLLLLTYILLNQKYRAFFLNFTKHNKLLLICSLLPVIIHLLVFFNSSVVHRHTFSKLLIPFSLFAFPVLAFVLEAIQKCAFKGLLFLTILTSFVWSILYFNNHFPVRPNKLPVQTMVSNIIEATQNDEAIYMDREVGTEHLLIYLIHATKRNIAPAISLTDAMAKAKKNNQPKGVYYIFDTQNETLIPNHFN